MYQVELSPPPPIHVDLELQTVTLFGNSKFVIPEVTSQDEVILDLGVLIQQLVSL